MGKGGGSKQQYNPYLMMPSYQAPPQYTPVPNQQQQYRDMIPQPMTPTSLTQMAAQGDQSLAGTGLNLVGNPLIIQGPTQDIANFGQQFYQNQINPQIQQTASNLALNGQGNSSFGGAQLGAEQAQGQYQAMNAGQGLYNSEIQNLLGERQNFFGTEGQMAQNYGEQQQQQGEFLSGLQSQANLANNAQQNSYNLQSNENQNQFNSNLYNQFQNAYKTGYGYQQQQNQFNTQGQLGLLNGGLQLGGRAIGGLLGGAGSPGGSIGGNFANGLSQGFGTLFGGGGSGGSNSGGFGMGGSLGNGAGYGGNGGGAGYGSLSGFGGGSANQSTFGSYL